MTKKDGKVFNTKASRIKRKFSPFYIITLLFLLVFVTFFIVMMVWGFIGTFKGSQDFRWHPLALPKPWTFESYIKAFQKFNNVTVKWSVYNGMSLEQQSRKVSFLMLIHNTLVYSLGGAIVSTLCPCLVAYAVAKFDKWFTSKILYGVVIVTMIIPIVGTAAASVEIAQMFGVYNRLWGNFIQKFNFLGLYFLMFHGNYKMLAKDYSEAAYLDGASEWQVFFRIIFPLVRNLFGTIVLIKFIEFWNDYNTVLLYLPKYPTLSYALFANTWGAVSGPDSLAAAFIVFLPMVIVFAIFQKKLLGNLSMGGVKE